MICTAEEFVYIILPDLQKRLIWAVFGLERVRVAPAYPIAKHEYDYAFEEARRKVEALTLAWFEKHEPAITSRPTHCRVEWLAEDLYRTVLDQFLKPRV